MAYRVDLGERFMARDTFRAICAHPIMPNLMGLLLSAAIFLKNEAKWILVWKCYFYRRKLGVADFSVLKFAP